MMQWMWRKWLSVLNPSCKIRAAFIARNIVLEENVTLEAGSLIAAKSIGKYTFINKYCLIDKNVSSIGRFCSIAYNVRIGLGSHPTDWVSTHSFAYDKRYAFVKESIDYTNGKDLKTVIGNDVWIGANSTILAGVKVGDGAIIGAHSLVTKDVEPYSIVVGAPAVHKRFRFDEQTRRGLMELNWWDWDKERIKENIDKFRSPELLLS